MTPAERRKAARRRGRMAEMVAAGWLRLKGYRILDRGVRAPRGSGAGEIDIVARHKNTVIFVEVKSRRDHETALNSVSAEQQKRLWKGAELYLKHHPALADAGCRFDVITISRSFYCVHLKDAFRRLQRGQ